MGSKEDGQIGSTFVQYNGTMSDFDRKSVFLYGFSGVLGHLPAAWWDMQQIFFSWEGKKEMMAGECKTVHRSHIEYNLIACG